MEKGKFKYHLDDCNISLYADKHLNKVIVNHSSEIAAFVLKDIISQALKICKEGIRVKLNFKIGSLIIHNYEICFVAMGPALKAQYSTKGIK